ncbi:MAG: hypothetical protein H8E14_04490 [Candidatus Marinimicrobia bacterium]|nr:hypothetical protein [Candidatus Neomarinimicrobiota bacterium]
MKNSIKNDKTEEIRKGIRQIASHLLMRRYSLPEAKISAARIAYLAAVIRYQQDDLDTLFNRYNPEQIADLGAINNASPYNILNRLRNALPEAFYYWYLVASVKAEYNK